ncbi:MAG: CoA pyrophosphatase [Leptothrix sp. (in: b-proteobacteria)]
MSSTPPRLIRNPAAVPVIGVDDHLPALAMAQCSEAVIRQRFRHPPAWTAAFAGDGHAHDRERAPAAASVLVPLVRRDDGLQVLLTRRSDHLKDHAGQISFPGGRAESFDAGPTETALREAEEEVGLQRDRLEVLGCLPAYTTVTAFVVTPVVALVQPPLQLSLDASEVAEAFEVPLTFLMNPAHHRRHRFEAEGRSRQFLSMPWQGVGADGLPREYFVWGATAAMLRNLYHFLAA